MQIVVFPEKLALAKAAANDAASTILAVIENQGVVRIIAATGASQLEFLDELTKASGIDWTRVEMFHLDEYLGIPPTHPASFRKYLREHLIEKVGITRFHLLDGEADIAKGIRQLTV
jgi:glucosamine-6-phosphate deaminase